MPSLFTDMWKMVKDAGKLTLDINKDTASVKLLNTTIKSLETILAAMDTFLKSKNVDLGKFKDKVKEKTTSFIDKAKGISADIKEKGVASKLLDTKVYLKEKFSGFFDKITGPPDEDVLSNINTWESSVSEEDPSKIVLKHLYNNKEYIITPKQYSRFKFWGKMASNFILTENLIEPEETEETKAPEEEASSKGVSSILEKAKGKLSAIKDSVWKKSKDRQDKRKEEIEKEKKDVQENLKNNKAKKTDWLGKLLKGIMTVGGFIVTGIKTAVNFLGGFMLKGIGNIFTRFIPALSSGIAGGLQSLLLGGLKKLPGVGMTVGKGAFQAAKTLLPQAAGMVGRGAMLFATNPFVLGVAGVAAAAYGGYKLYKYLTRNDVRDDIYGKLTMLRLQTYGFNEINKDYFSKIFDLEMLMKDYTKFKNYKAEVTKLDKDGIEKVLDIFSVTREDKEKYTILNNWFMKRFIPAYKAFIGTLWTINNSIFVDSLENLKQDNLETFIAKYSVPNVIYNVEDLPIDGSIKTTVTKDSITTLLTNIKEFIMSKAKKPKTSVEKAAQENKDLEAKKKLEIQKQKQDNEKLNQEASKKQQATANQEAAKAADSKLGNASPDQEGETKPKEQNTEKPLGEVATKANNKLNLAQGELVKGNDSLQGISTNIDTAKIHNLDPNVKTLFTGMAKEYNTLTGKNIQVNEAHRSFADQKALYEKMPDKAAKPGNSTHEFGLAIDVNKANIKELNDMGLLRKYGFTAPVGGENWHIEPIGVSINPSLAKTDPNFRYQAITASPGAGGDGYGLLSNSVLKKRDIPYQKTIFESTKEKIVDPEKMKDKTADTTLSSIKSTPPVGDKPTTPTDSIATGKGYNKTSVISPDGKNIPTTNTTETPNQEGEMKTTSNISMPKTKQPIQTETKQNVSLDSQPTDAVKDNKNLDLSKFGNLSVKESITQAAKMTGVNETTLMNFAKLESNFNPNAATKPPNTAKGLFQITKPTWDELVAKHGKKYGITPQNADVFNPLHNALMAGEYSKQNLKGLKGYKEAGIEDDTALYMSHFLGPTGANKFFAAINKDPNTPSEKAVSSDSYNSNENIFKNKTVSQVVSHFDNKMKGKAGGPPTSASTKVATNNKPGETPASTTTSNITSETPKLANATSTASSTPSISPTKDNTVKLASLNNNFTSGMSTPPVPKSGSKSLFEEQPSKEQKYGEMFNSGKMESILTEQLDSLSQIVKLLTNIDGKFNLDNLKGLGSGNNPAAPKETQKSPTLAGANREIPSTIVDLSRRKITT